jgi:hypothetical protein
MRNHLVGDAPGITTNTGGVEPHAPVESLRLGRLGRSRNRWTPRLALPEQIRPSGTVAYSPALTPDPAVEVWFAREAAATRLARAMTEGGAIISERRSRG